jgi:DNA-directed RNA polymerase specialized sigma24 family protein
MPVSTDVITKAIAAHGQWKQRLRDAAATGKSDFRPEVVKTDNACDLGKWIYSEAKVQMPGHPGVEEVRRLHAEFHQEAAKVLSLALLGKRAEAEAAMAMGSPYSKVSTALVNARKKLQAA